MSEYTNIQASEKINIFTTKLKKYEHMLLLNEYSLFTKLRRRDDIEVELCQLLLDIFNDFYSTRDLIWLRELLIDYGGTTIKGEANTLFISEKDYTIVIDPGNNDSKTIYIWIKLYETNFNLTFSMNLSSYATTISLGKLENSDVDNTIVSLTDDSPITFVMYSEQFNNMSKEEQGRWVNVKLLMRIVIARLVQHIIVPSKKTIIKQHFENWRKKIWH